MSTSLRCARLFVGTPSPQSLTIVDPGRWRIQLKSESCGLQLRAKRSEMMADQLEDIALRLFHVCGFANVTVDDIAVGGEHLHPHVLSLLPDQGRGVPTADRSPLPRAGALRLRCCPADEAPLHSVRMAFVDVVSAENKEHTRLLDRGHRRDAQCRESCDRRVCTSGRISRS